MVTPYVASVSFGLRSRSSGAVHPALDHRTKFEFFGRLASAASRYQAKVTGDGTERDILGAVVHEGYEILSELEGDAFDAPLITSGGAVSMTRSRMMSELGTSPSREADSRLTDSEDR